MVWRLRRSPFQLSALVVSKSSLIWAVVCSGDALLGCRRERVGGRVGR
ncbi:hypothetical protein TIFTF001_001849 [Ficus carica]|uniref:Uncharacterized protein n=1 Tax=Ficus carica TaxID=3494 RepID=A0AA88CSJ0_FICCA|nr:hypothetical protein TIFTF001_001849 [Ficus carica]